MASKTKNQWVVMLGTYPPRECGIATFTQDLMAAIEETFDSGFETRVVAMNPSEVVRYRYGRKVIMQIDQEWQEDYERVAKQLNTMKQVRIVCIQHEFGIFGGEWGEYVLTFLKYLKKPAVVTLHTVLPEPLPKVKEVVSELSRLSAGLVVMTQLSKQILVEQYGISTDLIKVIPHGIHPVEFQPSSRAKSTLGLSGKLVLSTFGFLSVNKGIEYMIEAMPEIVKRFPNAIYAVIGATHPVVLRKEGEVYRNKLIDLTYKLGMTKHVRFYNDYLSLTELFTFLKATDIYVSTSLNPNQAVSGTLSYALGTGRPVVATDFAQAKEYIDDEVGRRVNFRDADGYAKAINELLQDQEKRNLMGIKAYKRTRIMEWGNVAIAYINVFKNVDKRLASVNMIWPEIKLNHFEKMTDGFGMWQFANFVTPDKKFGYTVDDNARALIAAADVYTYSHSKKALQLSDRYLSFLEKAGPISQPFENYFDKKQQPVHELNSRENMEDSRGRALWALARTARNKKLPLSLRKRAERLCKEKWSYSKFTFPRSQAFAIKSLYNYRRISNEKWVMETTIEYAEALKKAFEDQSEGKWKWFVDEVTYANGTLCEAMGMAYRITGKIEYLECARESLNFLIDNTFRDGVYSPVGNRGWWKKGGEMAKYDQQPEEAMAMITALYIMYRITKEKRYKKLAIQVFEWFLGRNTLMMKIYDAVTGGCHDGLEKNEVNTNEGAESTVSYLLARVTMQKF